MRRLCIGKMKLYFNFIFDSIEEKPFEETLEETFDKDRKFLVISLSLQGQ